MNEKLKNFKAEISAICQTSNDDKTKLVQILRSVQEKYGCISNDSIEVISNELSLHKVEVESVITFYAFLSRTPKGSTIIRVCDDIIDKMAGANLVDEAFKKELDIEFGETTKDGKITLEHTPCIGMCDQAPAALINDVVFTHLSSDKVKAIVKELKKTGNPDKLVKRVGDDNNANPLVHSMVHNYILKKGEVIFSDTFNNGHALKKILSMSPIEVIREVKTARLRGRGGAGFPTGMKWDFTRSAPGDEKVVICNADEGEPGTFKDRAILTERADLVFEGMTIAGYAIGAETGILYLRGEYAYLKKYLEDVLNKRRKDKLLGNEICDKLGFNFDIQIKMGAGAYICGEETAMISSCEGLRGDPKNRPPFPAQKGFLKQPTTVNNVETLCCVVHIIEKGAAWFSGLGSKGSPGTKVLSISGDCAKPGVYEFPFGITVDTLLKEVVAEDTLAIQMGGPSGQLIGKNDFNRSICYDDLATGGSVMIFNKSRNILEIVRAFMEFFIEESCGYCTPCRVGNILLKNSIDKIMDGKGEPSDIPYLERLCNTIKTASRCGLGQTSSNPVQTSLKNFNKIYEDIISKKDGKFKPEFDISNALEVAEKIANHKSVIFST